MLEIRNLQVSIDDKGELRPILRGIDLTVRAEGVANGELAEVYSQRGTSLAQVIRIQSDRVALQVFAGADKPIARPLITAEHVHGKTGLDGPELHEPQIP